MVDGEVGPVDGEGECRPDGGEGLVEGPERVAAGGVVLVVGVDEGDEGAGVDQDHRFRAARSALTPLDRSGTIRAVRASPHRLVPLLVLLAWMAPAVGAFGVALHVALDHHGRHDGDSPRAVSELARTAPLGHHHDLTVAVDHHHEARVEEPAPALRPMVASVAVLPAPAAVEAAPAEPACRGGSPRRPPPDPLFTVHCSLLL